MTKVSAPDRPACANHILSYADSLRGGGVERALLLLSDGWIAAGRRVTLVIGDATGPLAAELPDGVTITGEPFQQAVRRVAPDIVFCPGNHYTARAAVLRIGLGRRCPPIVAKMSNALDRRDQGAAVKWGYRRWLALHPHFLDHLVAIAPALREEVIAATGIAPSRVSVIVDPPVRSLPGAATPPLPAGAFVLGVGRLIAQKRWDRLVAALPHLTDRDAIAVILGEGPERARLLRQAAALGVAERLWLPGYVTDPLPALARAAVAVLPSDYEGVPAVLREALSIGTPVVTTESSRAIREIVTRSELGTIVPFDDAAALATALDHWLAPGTLRPAPVPSAGERAPAEYLSLFDRLVARAA